MSGSGEKKRFLDAVARSIGDATFVRIALGKYRGGEDIERVDVTPVEIKGRAQFKFVTQMPRRVVTNNYPEAETLDVLSEKIGKAFLSATLFTTRKDVSLQFSKKWAARLTEGKATFTTKPETAHDRAKVYQVDSRAPYLAALGVTDGKGVVKPSMFGKFKQICRFIEIIDDLVRDSELRQSDMVRVADIGSGKGYLTLALYDYLAGKLGKNARVTGIEVREDLVAVCSEVARASGFSGLSFEARAAGDIAEERIDMLIALHACDTATDDAIFRGITSHAAMIVTAPCCQHEMAPQLKASGDLKGLLKFGLFKQRQADLITDAARCLLLEASGYKVKAIEFVSSEHTAKNIMIAAVRSAHVDRDAARREYEALKTFAGFKTQHLEHRLLAG